MCRANSTMNVCFSHVGWSGDALTVVLPSSKGDQSGENACSHEPKHLFANPEKPEICPVFGLGVLLMCRNDPTDPRLFPGTGQDSRVTKILKGVACL